MTNKLNDMARAIEAEYCYGNRLEDWSGEARAALLAIRDPGEDVLWKVAIASCDLSSCKQTRSCTASSFNYPRDYCMSRARRAWDAGIDALLGDET
tara:strand:- start:2822 stop:3109 length:288 start_codon:yes stop_codon:yes gene_type:complete